MTCGNTIRVMMNGPGLVDHQQSMDSLRTATKELLIMQTFLGQELNLPSHRREERIFSTFLVDTQRITMAEMDFTTICGSLMLPLACGRGSVEATTEQQMVTTIFWVHLRSLPLQELEEVPMHGSPMALLYSLAVLEETPPPMAI